ncbi:MAG: hypothetical protein LBQ54_10900 [Planctomycetaceae bacterium]|nr:hypothetical protein [Planctomycetaceae bacterium]
MQRHVAPLALLAGINRRNKRKVVGKDGLPESEPNEVSVSKYGAVCHAAVPL